MQSIPVVLRISGKYFFYFWEGFLAFKTAPEIFLKFYIKNKIARNFVKVPHGAVDYVSAWHTEVPGFDSRRAALDLLLLVTY